MIQAPNSVSMPLNLFGVQRRYFSSRFVPGVELAPRRYNPAIPFCHASLNIHEVGAQLANPSTNEKQGPVAAGLLTKYMPSTLLRYPL